jgi:GntR family transcriptional regulator
MNAGGIRRKNFGLRGVAASGGSEFTSAEGSSVPACIDTYDLVRQRVGISKVDLVPAQRIDPLGPVPPYRQIAAIIKRGILSGQYPADTRIPTESELVETYEVARSTARRAVAALREEGLVYTVPARGTYVAKLGGTSG